MRGEDLFFTVLALGGAALVLGRVLSLGRASHYETLSDHERRALFRRVVGLLVLSASLGALLFIGSLAGMWGALRATFTPVGLIVLVILVLAYAVRLRAQADMLGRPRLTPEAAVATAWIYNSGSDGGFGGGDGGGSGDGGGGGDGG